MAENGRQETALTLPHVQQLGDVLYKSGYFSDIKSAAQATVKVLRGQELGLGPVTALEQIHVVQGRTALSAGLIGAMIKRSGRYDYRITKHTDNECEIAFFENGKEIGRSTFTMKDAERAGLLKKDNWRQYPRNMLMARALSNGARWYCPDVFGGAVYTPEELQTIDVEAVVVDEKPQTQEQKEQKSKTSEPATEAQLKKIFATIKELGIDNDSAKRLIQERYGVDSSKKLAKAQASDFIEYLQSINPEEIFGTDQVQDAEYKAAGSKHGWPDE